MLLLKGFDRSLDADHERVLRGRAYRPLFVPDRGFDLQPYGQAARQLRYRHFCFLNSFGRPRADGWLARLHAAALDPTVGLAGASGSWETVYNDLVAIRRARHAGLFRRPDRAWVRAARRAAAGWPADLANWVAFQPFPAPHVRTNGFVMARGHVLRAWAGLRVRGKIDAWRFEHGRRSLTRRVARLGLRTVVVGRDGTAYDPPDWDRSGTFWQGDQANLLVADNQSDRYASGTDRDRADLSAGAWGRSPGPDPPAAATAALQTTGGPLGSDRPAGVPGPL